MRTACRSLLVLTTTCGDYFDVDGKCVKDSKTATMKQIVDQQTYSQAQDDLNVTVGMKERKNEN